MPSSYAVWRPGRSAFRGLAVIGGLVAWTAAAVVGVVLALVFTATFVVILFMAAMVLGLAAAALRARRTARRPTDPDLIEARHISGHSWVAYGWDGRR